MTIQSILQGRKPSQLPWQWTVDGPVFTDQSKINQVENHVTQAVLFDLMWLFTDGDVRNRHKT